MATNFVQEGNVIQWTNGTGSAVASGDVVQVGLRGMGVALVDIASTASGSVMIDGVFDLALDASDTTAIGGAAYWDASGEKVYNDPGAGRFFIGYFTEVKSAAASQTVGVKLAPFSAEGQRLLTMAATGAQTLAAADLLSGQCTLLVPNTAALTITLPSVASIPANSLLRVRKTTADAHAATLDGAGDETIAGGATLATIDANNDTALLQSTGAAWVIVDSAIA
jgi:predicted RecA/RadA family phage recombinase